VAPNVTTLFVETATPLCGIALESDGVITSRILDRDRRHVEVLMPGIQELLRDTGTSLRDVTRVVVDRGPGLYTGLRVGVATAVALADSVGAPLVGVTSLEVVAAGAHEQGVRGSVLALIDGRRKEVFAQSFQLDDEIRATSAPVVRTPEDIVVEYGTSGAPTTFVGDGAVGYRSLFSLMSWITVFECDDTWVSAGPRLGRDRAVTPVELLYLREPDAVANFPTRTT
jgi:tRNA threonylcarbamoyladenosine biosynthesis protein TsaB